MRNIEVTVSFDKEVTLPFRHSYTEWKEGWKN